MSVKKKKELQLLSNTLPRAAGATKRDTGDRRQVQVTESPKPKGVKGPPGNWLSRSCCPCPPGSFSDSYTWRTIIKWFMLSLILQMLATYQNALVSRLLGARTSWGEWLFIYNKEMFKIYVHLRQRYIQLIKHLRRRSWYVYSMQHDDFTESIDVSLPPFLSLFPTHTSHSQLHHPRVEI